MTEAVGVAPLMSSSLAAAPPPQGAHNYRSARVQENTRTSAVPLAFQPHSLLLLSPPSQPANLPRCAPTQHAAPPSAPRGTSIPQAAPKPVPAEVSPAPTATCTLEMGKDKGGKEKEKEEKEEGAGDYEAKKRFCSIIAKPLADEKLCKKVLKLCKKASKRKQIRRGVKEVVKALRKNAKGWVGWGWRAPVAGHTGVCACRQHSAGPTCDPEHHPTHCMYVHVCTPTYARAHPCRGPLSAPSRPRAHALHHTATPKCAPPPMPVGLMRPCDPDPHALPLPPPPRLRAHTATGYAFWRATSRPLTC